MSYREWQDHNLSGVLPPECTEDLLKCFPDDGGLSYEDICVQQESLYFSFQKKGKPRHAYREHGETSRSRSFPGPARNSSGVNVASQLAPFPGPARASSGVNVAPQLAPFPGPARASSGVVNVASQLALDEAFARSLQMDDSFDDDIYTLAGACVSPPREPPVRVGILDTSGHNINQDNMSHEVEIPNTTDGINLDGMSYEELQLLGDAIGHESRGLSDDIISRLPTFKYNNGYFFWKKKSDDECVICCSEYANREKLASLLCAHTFHFKCIKRWLKEKKTCPVCNEEVRDA
ncbi:unnamed protein product [Cuscuta europaea]|uniref:RING-type domain-containing protein n=1 Tax=Cuscuta europaea TaxID=41803 RepID=A0A9P0YNZ7_CUSEU|nr:unnamed protein product [Cuscuta europaea]